MPNKLMSEIDQKTFCFYCNTEIDSDKWKSEWHIETHYKTLKCQCGKDLSIKVDFEGSGHDSWNGQVFKSKIKKDVKNIEDKIRIIEGIKVIERKYPNMK